MVGPALDKEATSVVVIGTVAGTMLDAWPETGTVAADDEDDGGAAVTAAAKFFGSWPGSYLRSGAPGTL